MQTLDDAWLNLGQGENRQGDGSDALLDRAVFDVERAVIENEPCVYDPIDARLGARNDGIGVTGTDAGLAHKQNVDTRRRQGSAPTRLDVGERQKLGGAAKLTPATGNRAPMLAGTGISGRRHARNLDAVCLVVWPPIAVDERHQSATAGRMNRGGGACSTGERKTDEDRGADIAGGLSEMLSCHIDTKAIK